MRKVKIVQHESQAPMVPSAMEKKVADQSAQVRRYKVWKNAQFELIARGPLGEDWRALRLLLSQMSIEDIELRLVEHITCQTWLLEADQHTRDAALSLIANAIIRLRIRNGLAPIDDALPDQVPTAFQRIREILGVT